MVQMPSEVNCEGPNGNVALKVLGLPHGGKSGSVDQYFVRFLGLGHENVLGLIVYVEF